MRNPVGRQYIFHSDPGHGWLAVKVKELYALGIHNRITSCSYLRGATAYLEEDVDAPVFLEAYERHYGSKPQIREIYRDRTSIRSYPHYHLGRQCNPPRGSRKRYKRKRFKNPMKYFVEVSGKVVSEHPRLDVARMKAKEWKRYYGSRTPVKVTQRYDRNPKRKRKKSWARASMVVKGPREQRRQVTGKVYNGLFLHEEWKGTWSIVHVASGLSVATVRGPFEEARAAVQRLSKLVNWERPADELVKMRHLRTKIKKAVERAQDQFRSKWQREYDRKIGRY